ncbi:MAG: TonB-dependent receptor plug domain-containing protein, partial [Dinghuibacter sp.]|nr:TonB-dependent receptor plug domain-containing protein [Dinghuibacter sp.]
VKYRVYRDTNIPDDSLPDIQSSNFLLLEGEAKANAEGKAEVLVTDTLLKRLAFNNATRYYAQYTIEAEATDGTGETQEAANLRVTLTNRPVTIEYKIGRVLDAAALPQIPIVTKSEFAGTLSKTVTINIYRLNDEPEWDNDWPDTDMQWVNGDWVWRTTNTAPAPGTLVHTQQWLTGTGAAFSLPRETLTAGQYKMVLQCVEQGAVIGETTVQYTLFDSKAGTLPASEPIFGLLPINSVQPGDTVKWTVGNNLPGVYVVYHVAYFTRNRKLPVLKYHYQMRHEQKGVREWLFKVPANAEGEMNLTRIFIVQNRLYKQEQKVYISRPLTDNPEIIVEQYRKVLVPGEKETFAVTVKTKNIHAAAELMTTMYDASLEKLEKHRWNIRNHNERLYVNTRWNYSISNIYGATLPQPDNYLYMPRFNNSSEQPLWWLNPLDYAGSIYLRRTDEEDMYTISERTLMGRVAGLRVSDNLAEVVVTGYGTQRKANLTGSVVSIRGVSSFSSINVPLVVIDGVVYEKSDLEKINWSLVTDIAELKGADATNLYGSRAAQGVLIVSTKGPVQLPEPPPPPIAVRKNFSETAFFMPQLYAGRDGYYRIEFAMPESVTEWKWKLLAHSKKARFAQAERTIYTQLPMMVQPAIPRFLFPGDQLVLRTRISNL